MSSQDDLKSTKQLVAGLVDINITVQLSSGNCSHYQTIQLSFIPLIKISYRLKLTTVARVYLPACHSMIVNLLPL